MPSSTRNVQLGICKVFFDGKDLGYTKGGVEVSVTTETYRVEIDQFGRTAINELIQGRNVQVTAPLAESTLENLVEIMPGASLVTDGVRAAGHLTFSAQPTANSTVTVSAQAFTFVTGTPSGATQVKIGATLAETIQNLIFTINNFGWGPTTAAFQAGGVRASLNGVTANRVDIVAIERGTLGNAITLAAGSAPQSNGTASGASLAGGVNITRARVDVRMGTDVDMLAIARNLRLHPVKKADNDYSDDFIVFAAAPAGSLQFSYQQEAERIFSVTFSGYPDPTQTNPRLFAVGDPFYQP